MRDNARDPGLSAVVTSRRGFLRGALGLTGVSVLGVGTLSGCGLFGGGDSPSTQDQPNPLAGFAAAASALADRYDATIAALPALAANLTPIRDAHRAHARAVASAVNEATPRPAPSSTQPPADAPAALAALVAAENAAHDSAVTTCLSAPAGLAGLVGSIAAARATHLVVLSS